MKLHPDASQAPLVKALTLQWLQVDEQRFSQSVLVSSWSGQAPLVWHPRTWADLRTEDLVPLASSGAELVILGSGHVLRLALPAWWAPFAQRRVGLESMDTAAACRTYNVLASEGRRVLAALILERPPSSAC